MLKNGRRDRSKTPNPHPDEKDRLQRKKRNQKGNRMEADRIESTQPIKRRIGNSGKSPKSNFERGFTFEKK